MSPVISEQHYKNGMKKDENGFMDIDWCCSKVLNDWDELRSVFMQANAKKAIAPTQVGFHLVVFVVFVVGFVDVSSRIVPTCARFFLPYCACSSVQPM